MIQAEAKSPEVKSFFTTISRQVALPVKEEGTFLDKKILSRKICLSFVSKHHQKGKKMKNFLIESLVYASETMTEFEQSLTQCLSGQGK